MASVSGISESPNRIEMANTPNGTSTGSLEGDIDSKETPSSEPNVDADDLHNDGMVMVMVSEGDNDATSNAQMVGGGERNDPY